MVNSEGFKQTEIGYMPLDWEVKTLGECLLKNPDYGINAAAIPYDDRFPTYLRITDISETGKYLSTNKVSVNHILSNSYYLEEGDIVFARTGASVGKTYLYNKKDGRLVFAGFLIRIKANPEKIDYKYLIYLTQTKSYWNWVVTNSVRSGQPGLNSNEYKSLQIPIPNLPEQTTIATALSDADALITSLEKLIEKKRTIKQGAMQQLLAPKVNWLTKKLGEIADDIKKWSFTGGPFGSNLKSSDYTETGIRIIQLQNIGDGLFHNESEVYTSKQKADELLSCNIYPGDIILSKMGDPVARACIIPNFHDRYLMCSDGIRLAVNERKYNTYFVYTYINSPVFRLLAENNSTGSTRKRIGLTQLKNLELRKPELKEQKTIAETLYEMDSEIVCLEQKLDKYKLLKQGMMQELLTGKIRLV